MKNKSDINQLYNETQKLYEKLSILRFVEEHFGDAKPTIGQAEIIEKMKHFFEEIHITDPLIKTVQQEVVAEEISVEEIVSEEIISEEIVSEEIVVEEIVPEEIIPEEIVIDAVSEVEINEEKVVIDEVVEKEEKIEEPKDKYGFLPAFELDVIVEDETPNRKEETQISFMDLLGADYTEPMFVKLDHSEKAPSKITFDLPKEANVKREKEETVASIDVNTKNKEPKSVSLNDKFSKGITIGLNDRIAFVKHLFGNSDEDYNRVMNQLITYDNFEEAQNFIDDMVRPDYNSWAGKEDYSQRFLEIIEKKFT